MLKNKKKTSEENLSAENQPKPEIEQELEQVNQARNQKTDVEEAASAEAAADVASATSEEEKLRADLAEANDKFLRLYAEFDNYKRRTSRERIDLLQTASKDVVVTLLPILDDFERALKAMESATDVNAVKEGVNLVHSKLKNTLTAHGLKEMESKGTAFDPEIHEAITNIPAPADDLKGKVIDEVEKGYYLNEKVIRYAKVVVGS